MNISDHRKALRFFKGGPHGHLRHLEHEAIYVIHETAAQFRASSPPPVGDGVASHLQMWDTCLHERLGTSWDESNRHAGEIQAGSGARVLDRLGRGVVCHGDFSRHTDDTRSRSTFGRQF
jgi:hypothetical protein